MPRPTYACCSGNEVLNFRFSDRQSFARLFKLQRDDDERHLSRQLSSGWFLERPRLPSTSLPAPLFLSLP